MAKDVERMVVELSADIGRLERGMKAGQAIVQRQTRAIERSFEQMNRRTTRSVSDMGEGIRNTIAGIALGAAVREVQQYADAWTRMGNPLRAAGLDQAQVNDRMEELVAISLRSRSSLEGTVTLYNRLIAASGELGVSQERVARVVETVNKALATSNLSASERSSAVTQLAQGLGSGNLAGDELRAIRENSQVLAQAIADEFDTTIGKLKELGAEGKLTAAGVFSALENAQAGVDAAFARTTATIGDSFTNLQTRAMQYVGSLDEATGASEKFASLVGFVANNLEAFGDAAVVAATVVGGVLAGRAMAAAFVSFRTLQAQILITNAQLAAFEIRAGLATGALGRMSVAGVAGGASMRALSGAMAFFGGPIGLSITAVAAAIALVATETAAANEATRRYTDIVKENAAALAEAADVTNEVGTGSASAVGGVDALCDATGRLTDETWRLVDAQKEAIRTRIANAIDAIDEERRTIQNPSLLRRGTRAAGLAMGGPTAAAVNREIAIENARLRGLTDDRAALMARYMDISLNNERTEGGGARRGGGSDTGAGGGRRGRQGPSPEELAAMRTALALQGELDHARARGDEATERRIQRELDINALTEQMTRAQIANARALATEQIDSVIAAENVQKEIDNLLKQSERRNEARLAAEQALTEEMDRQLQVQIDLARIEGNEAVVLMLERELRLRREIANLGPNADPATVERIRGDNAMLNRAEDRAIAEDRGRDAARTFIDIVRADDIGTEIGNRFRQAAWDGLENLLAKAWSSIVGGAGGQGGGLESLITSAIGGFFGGRRALGGPVQAGKFYRVNENTPNSEWFAPRSDGWVGNVKSPRGSGRMVQNVNVTYELSLAGANGDAAIYANVRQLLRQSQAQTVAIVRAGASSAQLEDQLLKQ